MNIQTAFIALIAIICLSEPNSFAQSIKSPFTPLPIPIQAGGHDFISSGDFIFTDGRGIVWKAPAGTVTDGASIPQACMSIIGPPLKDEYRGAALVHDAFCGRANAKGSSYHKASWEDVHQMFYEACIAGGTPEWKAKTMYAAVWLFGPHDWVFKRAPAYFGGTRDIRRQEFDRKAIEIDMAIQVDEAKQFDVSAVAEALKTEQLIELSKYIKNKAPDIKSLNNTMLDVATTLKDTKKIKKLDN